MICTKMHSFSPLPNLSLGQAWVEPLFAGAKGWYGSRRFRLRTLVGTDALPIAGGQNIKGLFTPSRRLVGKVCPTGTVGRTRSSKRFLRQRETFRAPAVLYKYGTRTRE